MFETPANRPVVVRFVLTQQARKVKEQKNTADRLIPFVAPLAKRSGRSDVAEMLLIVSCCHKSEFDAGVVVYFGSRPKWTVVSETREMPVMTLYII